MQVKSTVVNHMEYWSRLDEETLKRLVAEAVAKEAGIDLAAAGVTVERCWITSSSGGLRTTEYSAEVLIKVERP